jgi:Fe-S cluster biosynthesis and repair protein YggX
MVFFSKLTINKNNQTLHGVQYPNELGNRIYGLLSFWEISSFKFAFFNGYQS